MFGNRLALHQNTLRPAPFAQFWPAHLPPFIADEATISLPLRAAVSASEHDNKPVFTDISRRFEFVPASIF